MNPERLQILRMVQEGKVSPDEAAKLLDALETPAARPVGPRPTHVRIAVTEDGRRTKNFSVGISLVSWALEFAGRISIAVGGHQFDRETLEDAISRGITGKVFAASEEGRRVEIWLDP